MVKAMQVREISTALHIMGKTAQDIGFPQEWERDFLMRGWIKSGLRVEGEDINFFMPDEWIVRDDALREAVEEDCVREDRGERRW